jgi:hypothetical protein
MAASERGLLYIPIDPDPEAGSKIGAPVCWGHLCLSTRPRGEILRQLSHPITLSDARMLATLRIATECQIATFDGISHLPAL